MLTLANANPKPPLLHLKPFCFFGHPELSYCSDIPLSWRFLIQTRSLPHTHTWHQALQRKWVAPWFLSITLYNSNLMHQPSQRASSRTDLFCYQGFLSEWGAETLLPKHSYPRTKWQLLPSVISPRPFLWQPSEVGSIQKNILVKNPLIGVWASPKLSSETCYLFSTSTGSHHVFPTLQSLGRGPSSWCGGFRMREKKTSIKVFGVHKKFVPLICPVTKQPLITNPSFPVSQTWPCYYVAELKYNKSSCSVLGKWLHMH